MSDFKKGTIDGVVLKPLRKFVDDRGWLVETFRLDEIERMYAPVMSYTSLSLPGKHRGPHEHADQSDLFIFFGPGNFKIWLWDNRRDSKTYMNRHVFFAGQDSPLSVLVPPGVVHAYVNVSSEPGIVQNFPNQLFAGPQKKGPIDEIRHEDHPDTPYQLV